MSISMKKLILSIITLFAGAYAAFADGDVNFEAAAPRAVNAGDLFRIEFVVNAIPSEFIPPAIEGFEVLAGPSSARNTSMNLINGSFTKEESMTYTYVLQGLNAGVFTIPAAQVVVKGKTYSSKSISIEVVSGGAAQQNNAAQQPAATADAQGQGQGQGQGQQQIQQGNAAQIGADDIFARVTVSRSEVYKGEPVVVTVKLYTRVPFMLDDVKFPSFNGFWQQDISQEAFQQRETYNNRVYDTWTIKEYLLYPQQSGTLTIDPFNMDVVVRLQVKNSSPRNIFDELMGGGASNFQDIRKKIASPSVKVDVKEWPAGAPDSFNGAVGQFSLDAAPPQSRMNANTSGTYMMKLSGTGNFPLIRAPQIELPTSFEEYNVKSSESYKHSRSGTAGYRQFEYPFIPRMEGSYTIPEFRFSYFDPRQVRYVTLSSRQAPIEVAADTTAVSSGGGIVSGFSREDLKILGRDIRFINIKSPNLQPKGKLFMWSPLYLSLMGLTVALFFAGLVLLRRYVKNMQNDRFVRGKRANKVALRRFRAAEVSMKQGDKPGFYDEMLKALWGYMSDKLDIPMAKLTKDRIREELFERSIPEVQAGEYIRIISDCEEAQYSPTSSAQMNELYKEGVNLVSELESAIKR